MKEEYIACIVVGIAAFGFLCLTRPERMTDYKFLLDPLPSKKELKPLTDASIEGVFVPQLASSNFMLSLDKAVLSQLAESPSTPADFDTVKAILVAILKKTSKSVYDFRFVEMSSYTIKKDTQLNQLYSIVASFYDKKYNFTREFQVEILTTGNKQYLLKCKLNMNEKDTSGVSWSGGEDEGFVEWVEPI